MNFKTHDNEDLVFGQEYYTVDLSNGVAGRILGDIDKFYYNEQNEKNSSTKYQCAWFKHFGCAVIFSRKLKKENCDLIYKTYIKQED